MSFRIQSIILRIVRFQCKYSTNNLICQTVFGCTIDGVNLSISLLIPFYCTKSVVKNDNGTHDYYFRAFKLTFLEANPISKFEINYFLLILQYFVG